jgi:2,5-diketo-D-gluconate reductase A
MKMQDGRDIPAMGFGLWEVQDAQRVTETALALGYRLVDGAAIYGNEVGMGAGCRASGLPRDQLFVTTKVWNTEQGHDRAMRAAEGSLKRLGLDYVDLLLIHWPCPKQDLFVDTWRAFIALRDQGATRSIGVSNFSAAQIDRLTQETGVTPVLNQIELHPRLQQAALRQAHAARGIITQSWSPLGGGRSFDHPTVTAIAARTGATAVQVILAWHLALGLNVIPRSTRTDGLAENWAARDVQLTDGDMVALALLDTGERTGPDPDHFG